MSIYKDIFDSDIERVSIMIDKYNIAAMHDSNSKAIKPIQSAQFPATVAAIAGLVSAILGLMFSMF
jgi:hypothetical protein